MDRVSNLSLSTMARFGDKKLNDFESVCKLKAYNKKACFEAYVHVCAVVIRDWNENVVSGT